MTTTLPFLGPEVMQPSPVGEVARGGAGLGSRPDAFAQAMDRAGQAQPEVAEVGRAADDQARARQALELGVRPDAARVQTGDAILGGMQKLRGIFDASQNRISSIGTSNVTGVETIMAMQREVVHYSLLVDVTSKLSGKATQTVDQLMKGQ